MFFTKSTPPLEIQQYCFFSQHYSAKSPPALSVIRHITLKISNGVNMGITALLQGLLNACIIHANVKILFVRQYFFSKNIFKFFLFRLFLFRLFSVNRESRFG